MGYLTGNSEFPSIMQYKTELLSLDVSGLKIEIERVINIDELFEQLIAKGEDHEDMKDEKIPYWAELWASAFALSQFLVESGWDLEQKRVLEIGAGLGLPSIVAGKLGAKNVIISDYLQGALDFSEKNWKRNNTYTAEFLQLDWRNPDESLAADLLLAADIAYEKRAFEFLPIAFKKLCKKNGCILLTEPNRGFAQEFIVTLSSQGFEVEKKVIPVELFGLKQNVNLLIMRKINTQHHRQ